MVQLIASAKARITTDNGAVVILAAASMFMFLAMAALVVDLGNVQQNRRLAQATADAAVLAAAQDLPDYDAAVIAAKEYAARNFGVTEADWVGCADAGALPIATTPCISASDTLDEIRVRLPARSVPVFFATFLGVDTFSVAASATADVELSASGAPDSGAPGDGDPNTPGVRDGDPGGGYPPCDEMPDWDAGTDNKWTEFIFVFEHLDGTTATICGTSKASPTKDAWVPGAGGTSVESPTGVFVHVSCSDIFEDGWTNPNRFSPPNGPLEGIDTEWRVVRYTMDKYKNGSFDTRCGEEFTPETSEPPETDNHIRLKD